ncbi:MAG: hypothetical protein JWM57_2725, partial [Phycisphaerales bacterium]|nr:hypothetical protein [Phycisphaerales bacterium]
MHTIDLNCDLGEGFPYDGELIPLVSSINIACGGHAGDDDTMRAAIRTSREHGVNVGAHPGYEDRAGFGRVELSISPADVRASVARQVRRLYDIAASEQVRVSHVKPHGALYNAAAKNIDLADAIAQATADLPGTVALIG